MSPLRWLGLLRYPANQLLINWLMSDIYSNLFFFNKKYFRDIQRQQINICLCNSSWLTFTKMFHVLHDVMTGIQTMTIDMFDFSKFKEFSESASLVVSKVEAHLENRYAVHLPTNLGQFPISSKLCIQPWCHRFPSHWIHSVFSRAWGGEGQSKNHPVFCNCKALQLPSSIPKCFTT